MNPKTIKFLDKHFGGILINLLYLFGKVNKKKSEKTEKILVIMFWGIGSIINAMPVLRALKERYPKAKITVLAPKKNKDLFYDNKFINDAIFIDLSISNVIKTWFQIRNKFDLVIDTEHWLSISTILSFSASKKRIGFSNLPRSKLYTNKIEFNPGEHAVINNLNLARLVDAKAKPELIKIETSRENKHHVENFLKKSKIKDSDFLVGISSGSGETFVQRRWPKEKFAELADLLVEKYNAKVIFVGTEGKLFQWIQDNMKNPSLNSLGFTLGQSLALIDKCKLFIGNDSGPVHMSAAQKVKTIGLYGPETPVIFGPYGPNIAVYKGMHCSPHIKVYEGKYLDATEDDPCLRLISVKEVSYYVDRIMKVKLDELLITSNKTI